MSKKPFTYISLFSCAGVGCYGFKQAGFECVATNELSPRRLVIQNIITNVAETKAIFVVI